MKLGLMALTLVSSFAWAQKNSSPLYCQNKASEAIHKIPIPGKPNYFFRAFAESMMTSYANNNANYILNEKTQAHYRLPGIYDPVPVGETVMSVPNLQEGMAFYSVAEILSGQTEPKELARSPKFVGVYQSVGLMESEGNEKIYGLVLAVGETNQFQKIKVIESPELKVEPIGLPIDICHGIDLKLPMLSKDGREISGVDMKSGTSKVWQINHKTGSCDEVENLGFFAGKADFSFDGRYLAFHLRADSNVDANFFVNPKDSMSMNAFLYDRVKRTLTKVSDALPGENAYYPVFKKDGTIVYAHIDRSGNAWFAHVDMKKMQSRAFNFETKGFEKNVLRLLALGRMWNKKCSSDIELKTAESVLTAAFTLTAAKCRDMVKEGWGKEQIDDIENAEVTDSANGQIKFHKKEIQSLSQKDLEEACEEL